MTNFVGFGTPNASSSVYFDLDTGALWRLGPNGWVEQGTATPPPPVEPPPPPVPPPPPPPVAAVLRGRLLQDMTTAHEGNLDGVPDGWDWAHQPKHGGGWNNPGPEYQAAVCWGQIYSSNTPVRASVEIANLKMAVLSRRTRTWTVVQSTRPQGGLGIDGGYWRSDFAGNTSEPGIETTPTGSIVGSPDPGFNMHFYASQRTPIDNEDIAGVCIWLDARLIPGSDPAARYLAGAGGDYWQTMDSPFPSNTDIAIGKHRYLKVGEWTTVTAHTLSAQDLDDYPLPPVTLAGGGVTPPPVVTPPVTGAWKLPTTRPVKVMAMGDSITVMQVEDPMGWATMPSRLPYPIELVGGVVTNGLRHEGHGAWCADDTGDRCTHVNGYRAGGFVQSAGAWVSVHTPDVVILEAGVNDFYVRSGYTNAQVAEAVGRVIDVIHQANPDCLVAVSLFGRDNTATNPLIEAQVNVRANAGRPVRYFDPWRGFGDGDYQGQGNVHPAPSGVVKMVASTAAALTALASV